jgi:hypothetical protein
MLTNYGTLCTFLTCCQTRWLASPHDRWWVKVFLEHITASHMNSRERWRGHKAGTRHPEQKNHVHHHVESERLLHCQQAPKWYQNEQRVFCNTYTKSTWTSDFSSRKGMVLGITCGSCPQLLSSHKYGFSTLTRRTWYALYTILTLFTWFGSQRLLLISYRKTKTWKHSSGWRRALWSLCLQDLLADINQNELNRVFRTWMQRVQEVSKGNGDYVRW